MLNAPQTPAHTTTEAPAPATSDWPAVASELIQARQTVLPKRLLGPGPDVAQQHTILAAAAAAPDHGQLLPWRFVAVPERQRERLAEVFAQALLERDASATPEQVAQAREKAHRAPWLMLVVVDGQRGDPAVDLAERILSAGCAVQNALLMATAMGFGSALTSGKALKSTSLRTLFGLHSGEHALCFVSVGTVRSRKPARARPAVADYLSTLGGA
ncbi:MAG: nitroreductase [Hydrogenophaga sp.]|uniref:nitroreductase family protein n=1 Tax=Hydrogenophaga sp. TaxID=1904254 RepID=UPI0027599945|nr:nitroreductase [Hydrogenophaga sp.]MDP2417888.1 nitroreductase [Hydrogenophaga sp.]MDZ4190247.1 nitroreductase [Hydrogenophaga sp.]